MKDSPSTYGFPVADRTAEDARAMDEVRAEIDRLDRIIVFLLAERTRYIEAAARIKDDVDEVRLDWRIEDVVAKVLAAAEEAGLPPGIAEPVWRLLVERSIAHEFEVFRAVRGLPER